MSLIQNLVDYSFLNTRKMCTNIPARPDVINNQINNSTVFFFFTEFWISKGSKFRFDNLRRFKLLLKLVEMGFPITYINLV